MPDMVTFGLPPVTNATVPAVTWIPAAGDGCVVVLVIGTPKLIVSVATPAITGLPPAPHDTRTTPPPGVGGIAFGPAAIGSVCPVAVARAVAPSGVETEHVTDCAQAT